MRTFMLFALAIIGTAAVSADASARCRKKKKAAPVCCQTAPVCCQAAPAPVCQPTPAPACHAAPVYYTAPVHVSTGCASAPVPACGGCR